MCLPNSSVAQTTTQSPLLIPPMRGLCPALLMRQSFQQMLHWVGFASHLSSWPQSRSDHCLFLLRGEHERQGTIELRWIRQRRISAISSCSCCSFTGSVCQIDSNSLANLPGRESKTSNQSCFFCTGVLLLEVQMKFHDIPCNSCIKEGI